MGALLLGSVLAAPQGRGEDGAPKGAAPSLPPPRLEVSVRPGTVYSGSEAVLEAVLHPPRRASYRWDAERGRLLSNDASLVYWEAPRRAGNVRVRVAVTLEGSRSAPLEAERVLRIRAPSTAGMVHIPGGEFLMGDQWTDTSHPDFVWTSQNIADKPAHKVRLSPYWIDRQRVTNRQYVDFLEAALADGLVEVQPYAVLGRQRSGGEVPYLRFTYDDVDDPEWFGGVLTLRRAITWDGERFRIRPGEEQHPVVDVTWAGADAYARFYGKSLPTEAQWEFAARGTDGRRFPWGNEIPTPKHASVNRYYGIDLHPVGTFSPLGDSPFGVQEMVGGVFEWVEDWFDAYYYADNYSEEPLVDPTGPHWGRDKTIRGVPSGYGLTGADFEDVPTCFRYSWIFEVPLGDGFANGETGFRTALSGHGGDVVETAASTPGR